MKKILLPQLTASWTRFTKLEKLLPKMEESFQFIFTVENPMTLTTSSCTMQFCSTPKESAMGSISRITLS